MGVFRTLQRVVEQCEIERKVPTHLSNEPGKGRVPRSRRKLLKPEEIWHLTLVSGLIPSSVIKLLRKTARAQRKLASIERRRTAMATATASKPVVAPKAPPAAKPPKEPKVAKPKIGLTDEELAAAVEGTLKPRKVLGTANQANLRTTTESGRPVGRPIGMTTGLPIFGFWAYFFPKNERTPKKDKMTDDQITEFVRAEFPGRPSGVFDHIPGIRRNFNNGMFTKNIPPKIQSNRYDAEGNIMAPGQRKRVGAPAEAPAAPAAPAPVKKPGKTVSA